MPRYRITNPSSATDLGQCQGDTPAAALDAMARDAACCKDVPAPEGGLRVTEVEAPTVNVAFVTALKLAAERHGDTKLAETCGRALARDRDASEHVGAIMHGATYHACGTCRGRGRVGRRKCRGCSGTGNQAHPQIDAMRTEALRAA